MMTPSQLLDIELMKKLKDDEQRLPRCMVIQVKKKDRQQTNAEIFGRSNFGKRR